jgi:type I restriction-modification system DNA methylase subunit
MAEALLNGRLLARELEAFQMPGAERLEQCRAIAAKWRARLMDGCLQGAKEESLQGEFLMDFFRDLLGYRTLAGPADGVYGLTQHPRAEVGQSVPDASLGFFGRMNVTRAVVELKDASTPLDRKQVSRENRLTPIEQAFGYVPKYDRCDWIIVSNFKEIRLYHKSRGMGFFEGFDIMALGEPAELKRFYFCLCCTNLMDKDRRGPMDQLVKDTSAGEETITEKFYRDYKKVRKDLLEHLRANNPAVAPKALIEKAQKILDRLVFIMFCQYTGGLLPPGMVQEVHDLGFRSRERSDGRVWREFKNFFRDIDEGRYDIDPPINAYNGGLFRPDAILEGLAIKDDVWEATNDEQKAYSSLLVWRGGVWRGIVALSKYDFKSDLNVNILGRIFEQSISDLEILKAEADGDEGAGSPKAGPKRKKDGIYYTPEFITRYIVERTLGRWLDENPGGLGRVAVLDPACGSGAFLNQALDFLRQRHQAEYEGGRAKSDDAHAGGMFAYDPVETDRTILLKNLFGVDLNEESVEITKLGLWLKTAKRHRRLEDLDANIKRGDSLIDDPAIAGGAAFDWARGFAPVMAAGGFDVIVGNPPYVNIDAFGHGSPVFGHLKARYPEVYADKSDLLFYFIKKGVDLLKDNGIMGLIVSNAFLFSDKAKKLRNHIIEKCSVLEIVNFERHQVFRDAGITTCIFILQKNRATPAAKARVLADGRYTDDALREALADESNFFDVRLSRDAPFALVDGAAARLNEKIDGRHKRLGDALHVGKGMETAADGVFLFDEYPSRFPPEFVKKRASGRNIDRYRIGGDCDYVLYFEDVETFEELPKPIQKHLTDHSDVLKSRATVVYEGRAWWHYSRPMHKEHYHLPKLFCSRRGHRNAFALDDAFNYMCFSNMTVVFGGSDEYDIRYVLALLNSRLLGFRYRSIGKQTGGGSFEYFPNGVAKLPIAAASRAQQQSLAAKAQRMIDLKKGLQDVLARAASFLAAKLGPEVPPAWAMAGRLPSDAELLDALEKARTKTPIDRQPELLEWLGGERASAGAFENEMAALDAAIDHEVYGLYGLGDGEIWAVEGRHGSPPPTKAHVLKDGRYTDDALREALADESNFFDVRLSRDAPFALVDGAAARLNEKIDGRHKRLGDALHVGSGMETAADGVFLFDEYPSRFPPEFVKKRVSGRNIGRYSIDGDCGYVLYFEDIETFEDLPESIRLHLEANKKVLSDRADKRRRPKSKWWNYTFPMHKEFYHLDKIWCSYRAKGNEFALDDTKDYIGMTNATVIFGNSDEYDLRYVLALLNSRLLGFRYRSIGKQTGGGSFEYFPNGVAKLPIAAARGQQQSLAAKAQRMIDLKKGMQDVLARAASSLAAELGPERPPAWARAGRLPSDAELLAAIGKARTKTPMELRPELLEWLGGERAKAGALESEMAALDAAIDDEVYGLYGITSDEIRTIEGG